MYGEDGRACWPAVVLNYTSKTQYLFRINKGCEDATDSKSVNDFYDPSARPVQFSNMIYIGDGDTDVPCMSILKRNGGHAVAVYRGGQKKARENISHLKDEGRVDIVAPADYSDGKPIDRFVKAVIGKVAAARALKEASR
jgi:hypothetical protein